MRSFQTSNVTRPFLALGLPMLHEASDRYDDFLGKSPKSWNGLASFFWIKGSFNWEFENIGRLLCLLIVSLALLLICSSHLPRQGTKRFQKVNPNQNLQGLEKLISLCILDFRSFKMIKLQVFSPPSLWPLTPAALWLSLL